MKEITEICLSYVDTDLHDTVELMGCWGWEFVSNHNDRVTFCREKDAPWYEEVRSLERQYNELQECIDAHDSPAQITGADIFLGVILCIFWIVPGVVYLLLRVNGNKRRWKKKWGSFILESKEKQASLLAYAKELQGKAV